MNDAWWDSFRRRPEVASVDRFVCRREGHSPVMKLTVTSANPPIHSYLTTCSRCGAAIEVALDTGGSAAPEISENQGKR